MPSDPKTVGEAAARIYKALLGTEYAAGFIQDVYFVTEDEAWKEYDDAVDGRRKRAHHFSEFCKTALGHDPATLADRCRRDPVLKERVEELSARPVGRPPKGETLDNVQNKHTPSGNDSSRAIRQLREAGRQDLVDRVASGEISANKAAIAAGLRRPTATVYVDTAEAAVRGLLKKFSPIEIMAALQEMELRDG